MKDIRRGEKKRIRRNKRLHDYYLHLNRPKSFKEKPVREQSKIPKTKLTFWQRIWNFIINSKKDKTMQDDESKTAETPEIPAGETPAEDSGESGEEGA